MIATIEQEIGYRALSWAQDVSPYYHNDLEEIAAFIPEAVLDWCSGCGQQGHSDEDPH
jgi:hypothetical protein